MLSNEGLSPKLFFDGLPTITVDITVAIVCNRRVMSIDSKKELSVHRTTTDIKDSGLLVLRLEVTYIIYKYLHGMTKKWPWRLL